MNFIKRAFLSMKQRKIKSIILVLIFFIVTNLVMAGFTIQKASQKASDLARQKLGADVTLKENLEKSMGRAKQNGSRVITPNYLEAEKVEKLAKFSYVKDFNVKTSRAGKANGFTPVTDEKDTVTKSDGVTDDNENLSIEGVRNTNLEGDFQDGKSKIIEGKSITQEVQGIKAAVIEKRLAEKNNLKVGDKIQWKTTDDQIVEYEIIGIYKTEGQPMGLGGNHVPTFMNPANKIYVPYKSLTSGNESSKKVQKAIYYLKDPKYIEKFKEEAKKTDIDFDIFQLDAHDKLYKQMSGPIENIASISKLIIYVVSIAGAVILGLIITLSIKDRRKELGILLSIGERKWKLMGQLILEVLCVATLAFSISLVTGEKISQTIGSKLLASEVSTVEEEPTPGVVFGDMDSVNQKQTADPIDAIDVSVTGIDVGKVGGIGLGIILLSTVLPALSIFRLNPKDILLKDE
ncbi:ABC transporter permease [Bacillus cereus]|nr:ABC transporter permease [Bacillus cereus]